MTREELYRSVWSTPIVKLANELGLSGSYLARVCTVLNVPRPERGFWAKLHAGAKVNIPALPSQRVGEPLEWSKDGGYQGSFRATDATPAPSIRKRRGNRFVPETHALINGARKHFESGRPIDREIFLKPYKKLLVDITASPAGLAEGLEIANELYNSLESRGFRVAIAPQAGGLHRPEIDWHVVPEEPRVYYPTIWKPARPTVVYVGDVAIGVALLEMAEPILMRNLGGDKYIRDSEYVLPKLRRGERDWSWTTTRDMPTGRFRLQLYSPYGHVAWKKHWQETKAISLANQIQSIVNEFRALGNELTALVAEADRKADLRRLEWERACELHERRDDRAEVAKSRQTSQVGLSKLIEAWTRAENTSRFFESIEAKLHELPNDVRQVALARIALAKEFASTSSPWDLLLAWKTPTELYIPRFTDEESEE